MNLEQRLERLERDHRRLKRTCTGLAAALGALLLLGAGAGDGGQVVEARAFRLVDAAGQARGEWKAAGAFATFKLLDKVGRTRLMLAADGRTQSFSATSPAGEASLSVTGLGPSLHLVDSRKDRSLRLTASSEGAPCGEARKAKGGCKE